MFSSFASYFVSTYSSDILDEKMEEYRMLSGFKIKEICRIRNLFLKLTESREVINQEEFLKIECIAVNPLKDRLSLCFGFEKDVELLDFQSFLCGLALFNSPGKREQKLRLAFRIQDFDGDGVISKADMVQYLQRITASSMSLPEIEEVVAEVFRESASDAKQEALNFSDFQRVVAPMDFQAKLLLPI
jgi:Ca2+-binding EF-hand superfamily protein